MCSGRCVHSILLRARSGGKARLLWGTSLCPTRSHSGQCLSGTELSLPCGVVPAEIAVTEEEAAAIDRLQNMGFERAACIEAFIACDRNEEAAANFLLENMNDDM